MGAPLGNQNAVKPKEWDGALKRAMARRAEGDYRLTLERIADKVIDLAMQGDKDAWKEVGDRMDGKPPQTIAGDPEAPLTIVQVAAGDAKI